jgi:hypothetical protein
VLPTECVSGVATIEPAGTTTYSYVIGAHVGSYIFYSDTGVTTQGHVTLSGTFFNQIVWAATAGASSYDVWQVQGFLNGFLKNVSVIYSNDTGFEGNGAAIPAHFFNLTTGPSGSADITGYVNDAISYGTTVTWEVYDVTETLVLAQG